MSATEASGNGPDTAERAPLDARGWVPSVFRARPANDKDCGRAIMTTPRVRVRRDDEAQNEMRARHNDDAQSEGPP